MSAAIVRTRAMGAGAPDCYGDPKNCLRSAGMILQVGPARAFAPRAHIPTALKRRLSAQPRRQSANR